MTRADRARSSMLWAAWADALGWISELTTEENLLRRTRGRPLDQPMAWQRHVGGRTGVRVTLPPGCYSDDTQLRLATARAINSYEFDVEAFARVELPIWLNYALGGGRSSKSAAASMAKQQANWATNFFDGWENSGGNGAAMRIQPHVLAASDLDSFAYLDDVIRNAIVTHGHPRGIVGAVLHAVSLSFTLLRERVPEPADFPSILEITREAVVAFSRQPELANYWLPQWERKTTRSFVSAWHETIHEVDRLLDRSRTVWPALRGAETDRGKAAEAYGSLARLLGLDVQSHRGSGTLTAVAALVLAAAFPEHPAQAAQIAAGELNTDTDTIGTMAAALVGAGSPRPLSSPVLDGSYVTAEADRLTLIALGRHAPRFPYPDLLNWQPPRAAVDAVGRAGDQLALAGLDSLQPLGEPTANRAAVWRWAQTRFGQSMLVKYRHEPRDLAPGNRPSPSLYLAISAGGAGPAEPSDSAPATASTTNAAIDRLTAADDAVMTWLKRVEHGGFQDADIGRALVALSDVSAQAVVRFATTLAERLRTGDRPLP